MSTNAVLIFPNQLFENHPAFELDATFFLVEEWLFFDQFKFHQQKLVLHRASMKVYEHFLLKKGFKVQYIEAASKKNKCLDVLKDISNLGFKEIYTIDPIDNWLEKNLKEGIKKNKLSIHFLYSPNFITKTKDAETFFEGKKKYFQTDFYIWQRKHLNVLLDDKKQAIGGKWTFDAENRLKFPKHEIVPSLPKFKESEFIQEAKKYVKKYYSKNYGQIDGPNLFVDNFSDSSSWFKQFLENKLAKFGDYEDAIVENEMILYHSVLTPMLNIGLINPNEIIDQTLAYAKKHEIPLNSLEGFIRQIIGWREFIKIVYQQKGSFQRTHNYWKFTRKIPKSFWTGTTGIEPIDSTIKKILATGYCHHIERLMVLGNFMVLCEFDPDEVYKWFMEMFIDAYDWVMVPNVYGMTQFADGGMMTTKPYISGSNYLMKMSDYKKGAWQTIWDGLFWRFMHVHRAFL